jgi:AraC family transcriptional regulator
MVCPRCISSVQRLLDTNKIRYSQVALGEVTLTGDLDRAIKDELNAQLLVEGFELLDDQRTRQIEQIKNLLVQLVQHGEIEEHFSLTKFLTGNIHKDYSHLSKLFSQVEGITIEQFFILQKIEKVKEWLVYNELSLNEISYKLGYSSVQHLSSQFKKLTGMTPSEFKQNGVLHRRSLDDVAGNQL